MKNVVSHMAVTHEYNLIENKISFKKALFVLCKNER